MRGSATWHRYVRCREQLRVCWVLQTYTHRRCEEQDFASAALMYGRIIIAEKHVADKDKSIKYSSVVQGVTNKHTATNSPSVRTDLRTLKALGVSSMSRLVSSSSLPSIESKQQCRLPQHNTAASPISHSVIKFYNQPQRIVWL